MAKKCKSVNSIPEDAKSVSLKALEQIYKMSSSSVTVYYPVHKEGSRVGTAVRALAFHQCVPGSIPGLGVIIMLAEFVGSLLCYERFFSGYSGFPLSSKTNI